MKKSFYVNIALFFLVIHLFLTNSRLLFHLNVDSRIAGEVFDFSNLRLDNIIAMLAAMAYSVITAIVIKLPYVKRYSLIFIIWYSLIDGAAVLIYYSVFPNFQLIGAIFYAIYTSSIILAIGLNHIHESKSIEVCNEAELELPIIL